MAWADLTPASPIRALQVARISYVGAANSSTSAPSAAFGSHRAPAGATESAAAGTPAYWLRMASASRRHDGRSPGLPVSTRRVVDRRPGRSAALPRRSRRDLRTGGTRRDSSSGQQVERHLLARLRRQHPARAPARRPPGPPSAVGLWSPARRDRNPSSGSRPLRRCAGRSTRSPSAAGANPARPAGTQHAVVIGVPLARLCGPRSSVRPRNRSP